MKLARKLTVALLLGIVAVMAMHAWVQVKQEVILYESDVHPKPRGRGFLALLQAVWRTDGEERVRELVEEAAGALSEVDTRWVSIDVPPGHEKHPRNIDAARAASESGEIATCVVTEPDGRKIRTAYMPVQQGAPLVLEATESLDKEMAYIRTSHRTMFITGCLIVAMCGLIIAAVGRRLVGSPLKALREQAHRMSEGDYSVRLSLPQNDEIGELAREMNTLCDRLADANRRIAEETSAKLAAFEQLRHSDRLATIGQLASGVAHELGTPISVVSARAQLVAADPSVSDEVRGNARIVVEQAARMTEIIRQLLDFSRRRRVQPVPTDLRRVVGRMLDLLGAVGARRSVRFELDAPPEPTMAPVDEGQLQQALTNIVLNGVQAMPSGGRIRVRIASVHATPPADVQQAAGEYRRIEIEDEGAGIAAEHLPHIFEPFFTTKGVGEGTGLGLSVAHGIVADHGGWIEVESTVGRGTRFRIYLPAGSGAGMRVAS